MATHHLSASIEGLLLQKNSLLGRLFNMNGSAARKELESRKAKGERYIPSDNCKHFNPAEGCECGKNEAGND